MLLSEDVIKFYYDYSLITSKLLYIAKHGKGLKILTPKQISQRLPIGLAQVKAGINSKYLLKETRQINYSLYQLNEITKKLYDNIIKSTEI